MCNFRYEQYPRATHTHTSFVIASYRIGCSHSSHTVLYDIYLCFYHVCPGPGALGERLPASDSGLRIYNIYCLAARSFWPRETLRRMSSALPLRACNRKDGVVSGFILCVKLIESEYRIAMRRCARKYTHPLQNDTRQPPEHVFNSHNYTLSQGRVPHTRFHM